MLFVKDIMVWIWLGVVALSVFVEAATLTLVSIWFAAGALCATFAAYAGVSLTVQLLIFVAVSIAACAAVRPLAQRYVAPNVVPTNAARVTEDIDNEGPSGAVYVDGKTWTARSAGGQHLPAGTVVEIEGMEGVKLIVRARAAVEESA